ncbi:MAG: YidC/Oxa1 family membrane protein insertase [Candidatus Magasanikbacteria bacterium]
MREIFEAVLYQPIFNAFIGLYDLIPDVGIAILILTVVIKLALYPMTKKSIVAQKSLQDIQPKLDIIKKEHKGDQQTIAQETMKLYKEHKVNPFGSCLPILVQLPIFLALYWVLRSALTDPNFELLYSFIPRPESIKALSLGFLDLAGPNIFLAVAAGAAQFWQAKTMSTKKAPKKAGDGAKDENMMAMMNKQMLYFMPVLTVFIGFQLPGGVMLYWFLSTLITALQQQLMIGKKEKKEGVIEGEIIEEKEKK